jgi:acyl-CoA thioester hydrolase
MELSGDRPADIKLTILVKGYDIDVAGIVHNSVYTCWLDDVRCAFLARVESIEHAVRNGYIPVLAKTEISYRRPIKFADKVVAHLWLTAVGKIKWGIRCEFRVHDRVVAEAHQQGCFVDLCTHRPLPMPDAFKHYWQNLQNRECLLAVQSEGTNNGAVPSSDEYYFEPVVCPV